MKEAAGFQVGEHGRDGTAGCLLRGVAGNPDKRRESCRYGSLRRSNLLGSSTVPLGRLSGTTHKPATYIPDNGVALPGGGSMNERMPK